ncbi:MAG: pentapeptide repeat-containing protein [Lactobacillales bacterium]|jgi:uncharacterized protein YjbI with pentapeptide repeats|nr:pentapeptide repeat-containing protein [Lactobacillales bacterium]
MAQNDKQFGNFAKSPFGEKTPYFHLTERSLPPVSPSRMPDYRSDPRAVRLIEAIAADIDLSGHNFSGINLKNANVSGGIFKNADFTGAVFYNTVARDCDFSGADFSKSILQNTDFSYSKFDSCRHKTVYARHLRFKNAGISDGFLNQIKAVEELIRKIEAGQIDIRLLTPGDIALFDPRRLDLSSAGDGAYDFYALPIEALNLAGLQWDADMLMGADEITPVFLSAAGFEPAELKGYIQNALRDFADKLRAYEKKQLKRVAGLMPTGDLQRPVSKMDIDEEEVPMQSEKARKRSIKQIIEEETDPVVQVQRLRKDYQIGPFHVPEPTPFLKLFDTFAEPIYEQNETDASILTDIREGLEKKAPTPVRITSQPFEDEVEMGTEFEEVMDISDVPESVDKKKK